jgi:hypothetical protein
MRHVGAPTESANHKEAVREAECGMLPGGRRTEPIRKYTIGRGLTNSLAIVSYHSRTFLSQHGDHHRVPEWHHRNLLLIQGRNNV